MSPGKETGSAKKAEQKSTKSQRISKLESTLKEVQAENAKNKIMLSSVRAKLDSLQLQIDRHQSGFEYLADSSEKLRDSLREDSDHSPETNPPSNLQPSLTPLLTMAAETWVSQGNDSPRAGQDTPAESKLVVSVSCEREEFVIL
ncbi:uncharacterized protein N7458_009070 [Penicillium daleae]|uniref:Uncharacterized protein n=1 Tax=Penicillium daleae TaxID=63821 RepID=A0AAD6FZ03_9EURO|nr:uncharacterized protein N7458_009070 [Penicillium daleae]KAJ5438072.1 hypothetical protein N7458_009070 [Penicillium daleae]